jgi:hypothetical protein
MAKLTLSLNNEKNTKCSFFREESVRDPEDVEQVI